MAWHSLQPKLLKANFLLELEQAAKKPKMLRPPDASRKDHLGHR